MEPDNLLLQHHEHFLHRSSSSLSESESESTSSSLPHKLKLPLLLRGRPIHHPVATRRIFHVGAQKGNPRVRARDVGRVVPGKELAERFLFVGDAALKKGPTDGGKQNGVQRIAEQQLRANGPVKETHVGGVSEYAVNAVRDQDVVFLLDVLNEVVEGFARGRHGEAANGLRQHDGQQPQIRDNRQIVGREKDETDRKFGPRGQGCCGVSGRVIDNEGIGRGLCGIVQSRNKEFRQMKGAESHPVRTPLPQQSQSGLSQDGNQSRCQGRVPAIASHHQMHCQLGPQYSVKSPQKT